MFFDIRFPTLISYRSRGGAGFNTSIIQLSSGATEKNSRWQAPRHMYDARMGVKKWSDLTTVKTFHMQVLGSAGTFRYFDPHDFTTDPINPTVKNATRDNANDLWIGAYDWDDVVIGIGDGTTTQFQMVKFYQYGNQTPRTRNITKIVSDGTTDFIKVGVNGVEVTTGWSVDLVTGIITFTAAPANGHQITAGCMFDVPVWFGEEADQVLEISLDDFDSGSVPSIPFVEDFEGQPLLEEYNYGGASRQPITDDLVISPYMGRFIYLNSVVAGKTLFLPDAVPYEEGGVHFIIDNNGGNAVDIDDGILTGTIANGEVAECAVVTSGGAKIWRVWK